MYIRILLLALLVLVEFKNDSLSDFKDLECWITSSQKVYQLGEVPEIEVFIKNNTKKDIYLIGSLDASEEQWRSPYCYFAIEEPAPIEKSLIGRCGVMNSLREQDFVLVKSGETFNPYQSGFFDSYQISRKENFSVPGIYKITFFYSTKSKKMQDYLGQDYDIDKKKLHNLFAKVPHVELKSNTIRITIKNK